MLFSHALLCGSIGSLEMSVFQTLSDGNIGQPARFAGSLLPGPPASGRAAATSPEFAVAALAPRRAAPWSAWPAGLALWAATLAGGAAPGAAGLPQEARNTSGRARAASISGRV